MSERKHSPRCGEFVLVNQDGSLRKHRRFVSGNKYGVGPRWVPCEDR